MLVFLLKNCVTSQKQWKYTTKNVSILYFKAHCYLWLRLYLCVFETLRVRFTEKASKAVPRLQYSFRSVLPCSH